MKKIFSLLLAAFISPTLVFSHPGGLDKYGGHTNTKTGEYHFHRNNGSNSQLIFNKYNRKDWPHWIDKDGDCQNTRAEILIRDNIGTIKFKRNKSCNVSWGEWVCPYTGKTYYLASGMDIDHIVPLSHAHRTGGANWSRSQKRAFANDPMNLLATEDNANQEKGDQAPNEWMPSRKSYWPEYAKKWRSVKTNMD